MNISIKFARLPHGLVYFYQHWLPSEPDALVVIVHGLGDHIGRYQGFVSRLTQKNFACALYDQRGHGRSEGRRGHIERFEEWVGDLASFVQFSQMCVPADTPLFLVGASLGALVGVNYLLTHHIPLAGMVSISAAIRPTVEIPEWKKKIARRLAKFFPSISISNGVDFGDLTGDEAQLTQLKADTLFHRRLSISAGMEIEKNLELVMAMPHRIHIPMLMLAGREDRICDPEGTRQFASRLSSQDKECRIYPEMRHDLLHERGGDAVTDEIIKWIETRARRPLQIDRQYQLNQREALWENVSLPS